MSRFLTPSKIVLLSLITLYHEAIVPFSASIPILSFIGDHILPRSSSSGSSGSQEAENPVTVEQLHSRIGEHASGIPGRTIWDLLLKKLWEINSLDALHQFFEDLSGLYVKEPIKYADDELALPEEEDGRIRLSKVSPLGAFVRRAQVEFTRLQFHDSASLWTAFVAFRAPTFSQWKRRNPAAAATCFDENLNASGSQDLSGLAALVYENGEASKLKGNLSTADVERILEHQVDQMQRIGSRLPLQIRNALHDMIGAGVNVPTFTYYVEFLDSWKAGDYPSAFDSLHRYFDYTMHNRDRAFYQYALLNLALLHADFESYPEALTAIEETIAVARENNDMACLNYSLSWLYHLGKAHPRLKADIERKGLLGPEGETLVFLKAKAKETQMWSLLSTALLSEARFVLMHGGSISHAFENSLKASHLNLSKHVASCIGPQMMMTMSLFSRLGCSHQAFTTRNIFQQCYADKSPIEDSLLSACAGANLLSLRGHLKEAIALFDSAAENKLHVGVGSFWIIQLGLLKLRSNMLKGRLDLAEGFLSQLKSQVEIGEDASFQIAFAEIEILLRSRDFSKAMEVLEDLASNNASDNNNNRTGEIDIWHQIKMMSTKARIFSSAGLAPKSFSIAMRAASLAWNAKIFPLLWEAINEVSAVCIGVSEFEAAAQLLESTAPQVLECEDCGLAGRTFALLAESHVGMAGGKVKNKKREDENGKRSKEHLSRALEHLERCFEQYAQLGDVQGQCEAMGKRATIMHLLGDPVLANDYAAKYLAIQEAAREQT